MKFCEGYKRFGDALGGEKFAARALGRARQKKWQGWRDGKKKKKERKMCELRVVVV